MNNPKIVQILGSGCITCQKLYKITQDVVNEIDSNIKVEYVNDVQKIIKMGLMQSPILLVNEKPVLIGFTKDTNRIKELIENNN